MTSSTFYVRKPPYDVCEGFVVGPGFVMQYLVSFLVNCFSIILLRKRELVAGNKLVGD